MANLVGTQETPEKYGLRCELEIQYFAGVVVAPPKHAWRILMANEWKWSTVLPFESPHSCFVAVRIH